MDLHSKRLILVYVNNIPVYVPFGTTVIQACEKLGFIIPRFCYHDLLEIAGNCRICLVEIEKAPKPQASCGLPVLDQIRIYTDTPLVKKAREGVLEFLLLNHPLDCPICDQGGECDLQNQVLKYGNTRSRFYRVKRGVEDLGLGPVVKTVISRCIHCTRCVRFAWDIAGVEDLGTTLRGYYTEIGTYVKKTFKSEVSGNIIDLCPVGALTSRVHAFKTRPWEVKSVQSIDTSDSLGSNILIETIRSRPIRIVPRPNKKINLEWLSDKGRFMYEGYISIRLAYPYFSRNGKIYKIDSYRKAKENLQDFLINSNYLILVLGRNLDLETLNKSKKLSLQLGIDIQSETPYNIIPTRPQDFQSTLSLNEISHGDSCLLLGLNPRIEATIANLRLRSRFKSGLFNVFNLGSPINLTYPSYGLGIQFSHLYNLVNGKHYNSRSYTKKPLIVYGDILSIRSDAYSGLSLAYTFTQVKSKSWLGFLRFPLGSNSVGKAFYGVSKPLLKNISIDTNFTKYLLGVENSKYYENNGNKYITETTHINTHHTKSCFVLPQQSLIEKDGSFINCIGLVQKTYSILRHGLEPLVFIESLSILHKQFKNIRKSETSFNSLGSNDLAQIKKLSYKLKIITSPIKVLLGNVYNTDRCSKASVTLAKIGGNSLKDFWTFL